MHVFDRQTDGQTDGQNYDSLAYARAVKTESEWVVLFIVQ